MRADTSPASIMRRTASSAAAGDASPACCAMSAMLQFDEQVDQLWVVLMQRSKEDRQVQHGGCSSAWFADAMHAMEWHDTA